MDEWLVESLTDRPNSPYPQWLEAAGSRYRKQGHLTRQQLYALVREVAARNAHYVMENTDRECETVTTNVATLEDDLSRITLLSGLHGLETTTASYVLTGLDPENYAIACSNVWNALVDAGRLEEPRSQLDTTAYCVMLEQVRDIADVTEQPAANVGFALSGAGEE